MKKNEFKHIDLSLTQFSVIVSLQWMNLNKNNGDHIGGQVFIGLSISFPFFGFMIFELFSRIDYNSKKCLIKVNKKLWTKKFVIC